MNDSLQIREAVKLMIDVGDDNNVVIDDAFPVNANRCFSPLVSGDPFTIPGGPDFDDFIDEDRAITWIVAEDTVQGDRIVLCHDKDDPTHTQEFFVDDVWRCTDAA